MKYLPILCLILMFSCNVDDDDNANFTIIEPVGIEEGWNDEIPLWSGLNRINLNSAIQFDRLYIHGPLTLYSFTEEGLDVPLLHGGSTTDFFTKNAFSKRLNAFRRPSWNVLQISFHEKWYSSRDNIYINPVEDSLLFNSFNEGYEIGAFNNADFFLFPVIKDDVPDEMKFFLTKVKIIDTGVERDTTTFTEQIITLPIESTTEVNRIESFDNQFFVSTKENTYRIDTLGNYTLLFNQTTNDFFEFDGKLYADNGQQVYQSTDNGQTWNLLLANLNYNGFRQFFMVNDNLYCFEDDQLYAVNPNDFSLKIISNRNLEGKIITSAIVYNDKVWLTTWDGIFTRSIDDF